MRARRDWCPKASLKSNLENGSRIIALPGDARTIRGLAAPAIVILDEAAYAEDDYIEAFSPMFATNSDAAQMLVLSTPNFTRGWFWEHWHNGNQAWLRVEVPATQMPTMSQRIFGPRATQKGPTRFAQEYMCQFLRVGCCRIPKHDNRSCVHKRGVAVMGINDFKSRQIGRKYAHVKSINGSSRPTLDKAPIQQPFAHSITVSSLTING